MNSDERGDHTYCGREGTETLVSRVRFSGLTPLSASLKNKVLDPLVSGPARASLIEKHRDVAYVCIVQMCVDSTWRSKSVVFLLQS
jgi:hypothetical protein